MTSDTSDTCLTLTGRRGIREAMQTRAELSEVVNANKNIIVDCSNVTEADLTLIQLLIAAGRSVAASGFRLTVRQNEEGALYKALQRGGFLFGLPSENCGEAGDPLAWMQSSRTVSRLADGARA